MIITVKRSFLLHITGCNYPYHKLDCSVVIIMVIVVIMSCHVMIQTCGRVENIRQSVETITKRQETTATA